MTGDQRRAHDRPRAAGHGHRRRVLAAQVLGVLIAAALVLAGADRLARWGTESVVARGVQDAVGTPERPGVRVRGTFFLPQVVRGRYDEVDVTTRDVSSGPLRLGRVDSRLLDVRVAFHDVLVRHVRRIVIGRSVQRAVLSYDDLDAYLDATGRPLTVSPGPSGEVEITGTVTVLGRRVHVSADAHLSARDGQLQVRPTQSVTSSTALDRASRLLLGQRLRFPVPLETLPFGHELTGVDVRDGALVVRAEGRGVVVEP